MRRGEIEISTVVIVIVSLLLLGVLMFIMFVAWGGKIDVGNMFKFWGRT